MLVTEKIKQATLVALHALFPAHSFEASMVSVNQTNGDYAGDYTVVLFPFVKMLRQKPDALAQQLGAQLVANSGLVTSWQCVGGFLNLTLSDAFWVSFLDDNYNNPHYGQMAATGKKVMIEYSSPNTNKPLHFGHLRNNFLGAATAALQQAAGNEVIKANLINDRGIHICKSMIAWMWYADGATPMSTGIKGDHFVGDYYVRFNTELNKELKPVLNNILTSKNVPAHFTPESTDETKQLLIALKMLHATLLLIYEKTDAVQLEPYMAGMALVNAAVQNDIAIRPVELLQLVDADAALQPAEKEAIKQKLKKNLRELFRIEEKAEEVEERIKDEVVNNTAIMKGAQNLLREWEKGDLQVRELWQTMNGWVYEGFDETYRKLGITFDKMYYESNTYLLGKQLVVDGLERGILFKKDDGSVWVSLKDEGLDEKLLLRGDGTSVYMTQDLGTAKLKYDEYQPVQSAYVIADEQNYHIQVLKIILKKLGEPCAEGIYHLSYGMVELPTGKMKSREGTVVDADDMIGEMIAMAREQAVKAGKTDVLTTDEQRELYETIGLGALKFYLLRVDPKKKMVFNPAESIELHGFTATFIQYAHTRICSILRKEHMAVQHMGETGKTVAGEGLHALERQLIRLLEQYPGVVVEAAVGYNPSAICNYSYQAAQLFNTFYDVLSISKAENEEKKVLRLKIILMLGSVLRHSMAMMGIKLPERM